MSRIIYTLALALILASIVTPIIALAGATGSLQLQVTPSQGSPGDAITITGVAPLGYSVNVSFVSYTGAAPAPGSYTVISSQLVPVGQGGRFQTVMIVPTVPYGGQYAVYAYVPGFEANTYDYVIFTIVPKLILNVTTVISGTTAYPPYTFTGSIVNITGVGFSANAPVSLYINETGTPVGSETTGANGVFTYIWTVMDIPRGTYTLVGTDGVVTASTTINVIPALWFYDENNAVWTRLLTVSGPWVRDLEENVKALQVVGTGFDASVGLTSITFTNVLYNYTVSLSFTTPYASGTDQYGTFYALVSIGHIPGGTYTVIVTESTDESFTFNGAVTFNAYIEAYDYGNYSALYGTSYDVDAALNPALKVTSPGAQVIVFGWAFAPGTITTAAGSVNVPAHIFIDADLPQNTLTISSVVNGTRIDSYNFLPDSNGFNVVIVLIPSTITRGGHEIGETQNITAPVQLRFSARTNIGIIGVAYFTPPAGTVGPYTSIVGVEPTTGIGVVGGSYAGPFYCLASGMTVCGLNVTASTDVVQVWKTGLGTNITVTGIGFDANQPVYVFIEGVPPVDLRILYPSYFATYASALASFIPDGMLVAYTTTDSTGSFSTWFLFPTLPGAQYKIWVFVGRVSGGFDQVQAVYIANPSINTFTVLPGFYLNPAVAVGPYVAEVVATGLPYGSAGGVSGVAIRTTALDTCCGGQFKQDLNDGIMGVNLHVSNWRITPNGTLTDVLSPSVFPGLYIPVLEPGVYELRLIMPDGSLSQPAYVGIFNDIANITNIRDGVIAIQAGVSQILLNLQQINATLVSVQGDVAMIKTDVGTIKTTVQSLQPVVVSINGTVADIKTAVGTIQGVVLSLNGTIATISTTVGTIQATVNSLSTVVSGLQSTVSSLSNSVGSLSSSLSDLSSKVDSYYGNLTSKIDASTSTLTNTINSAVSNAQSAITSAVNSAQSALSSKIDSAQSALSSQISTVSNYVLVALILALIAAAAAVYEVIVLHRKLAG
jgi:prefoldin subunit 5